MTGTFTILTSNGLKEKEGTIIKFGKGKKAIAVLGIAKDCYGITHIPSYKSLSHGYEYLSQARQVAQEILTLGGELLKSDILPEAFPWPLRLYIQEQWLTKEIPTLEEWQNGIDYENRVRQFDLGGNLSHGKTGEYGQELPIWDTTLAWVPTDHGGMSGVELRRLLEGRPSLSESVCSEDDDEV